MTTGQLPQRAARVTDEQMARIIRLAIQQVPHSEIARQVGVHRNTVHRVLKRTHAALAINEDTSQNRAEAIALYRDVQRTAYEAIAAGRSPAMLLAEIIRAQTRIDALLGTAPTGPDDPMLELQRFKTTVVQVIQAEAPELAPAIAERLRGAPVPLSLPKKETP